VIFTPVAMQVAALKLVLLVMTDTTALFLAQRESLSSPLSEILETTNVSYNKERYPDVSPSTL
jgi:hypothetical protein